MACNYDGPCLARHAYSEMSSRDRYLIVLYRQDRS
jgi:hypothetical protein